MNAPSDANPQPIDISVVVPAYNEQDNVIPLWEEVRDVLAKLNRTFEVVIADDGSRDQTAARLTAAAKSDPRLVFVRLARNYGQSTAMAAGIATARGSIIITLDGDRQNDPSAIPAMLERLTPDVDVVCGWRRRRQDKWLRSWVSRQANKLIARRTGVVLHDYGCTLRVMRAEFAKSLPLYGEMHRFIAAWLGWNGARIVEMEVNHRARTAGTSHYGLDRTFRVLLDLSTVEFMTRYRGHAVRFFGRWAWQLAGISVTAITVGLVGWIWREWAKWPPLLIMTGIMCALTAILLVAIGIVGELGWRIYFANEHVSTYRIAEVINSSQPQQRS